MAGAAAGAATSVIVSVDPLEAAAVPSAENTHADVASPTGAAATPTGTDVITPPAAHQSRS